MKASQNMCTAMDVALTTEETNLFEFLWNSSDDVNQLWLTGHAILAGHSGFQPAKQTDGHLVDELAVCQGFRQDFFLPVLSTGEVGKKKCVPPKKVQGL